jgi:hypothetical protein
MAKTIAEKIVAGLNYELPATRRLLERVPDAKGPWKPHPKSSALGHLAPLVARMPARMTQVVRGVDLDLAAGPGYTFETTETLLREFDGNVDELRASLETATDADRFSSSSIERHDRISELRRSSGGYCSS